MSNAYPSMFRRWDRQPGLRLAPGLVVLSLMLLAQPAQAHHPMGGGLPVTFGQGFLSGLGHPIIGLDHLAGLVAVGALAAMMRQGLAIPLAFVVATMGGTGLHILGMEFPGVELLIAGSVLLLGVLLVLKDRLSTALVVVLTAAAGLAHGYAYGEAIFGAEPTPLLAYLTGFTLIQLAIATGVFWLSRRLLQPSSQLASFRSIGLVISGVGLAFLSSQIVELVFPGS